MQGSPHYSASVMRYAASTPGCPASQAAIASCSCWSSSRSFDSHLAVPELLAPPRLLSLAGVVPRAATVQAVTVLRGQPGVAGTLAPSVRRVAGIEQGSHDPLGRGLMDSRPRNEMLDVAAAQTAAFGVPLRRPAGPLVIVAAKIDDVEIGHGHKLRRPPPQRTPVSLGTQAIDAYPRTASTCSDRYSRRAAAWLLTMTISLVTGPGQHYGWPGLLSDRMARAFGCAEVRHTWGGDNERCRGQRK